MRSIFETLVSKLKLTSFSLEFVQFDEQRFISLGDKKYLAVKLHKKNLPSFLGQILAEVMPPSTH